MECGIIGLPGTGKTTIFNALTGARAPVGGGAVKPNVGVANVPDPRLDVISTYVRSKKVTPATITFVDIPGIGAGGAGGAGGGGSGGSGGAAKSNVLLEHIRGVDAICHVVRCFNEAAGEIAPRRDIDALETELIVADMQVAESALDRAARPARAGDADAKARCEVLEKVLAALNEGQRVRSVTDWTEPQQAILRSYGFISAMLQLLVANVAEGDIATESDEAAEVRAGAEALGGETVVVCGKLEAELAELEEVDRAEMLEGLGLEEAAIGPLARAASRLLGLASFYTTSEKEIRAWTIPARATAPEAAGVVHSDMQRGFIRAECYSVDDLEQYKDEKALREAGRLRTEGKHYRMQDGDVARFLFNV